MSSVETETAIKTITGHLTNDHRLLRNYLRDRTGGGTFPHNTWVTLTATPDKGYRFLHWMENGQIVSTDAEYSFLATKAGTWKRILRGWARSCPEC